MTKITPIVKIDNLHACIAVSNLEESINWYQDMLGFTVLQQQEFADFSARVVYLESNGIEIELVESKDVKPFRRLNPPIEHVATQGISQLSFRVENLDELVERIKERAVEITFGPIDADVFNLKAFFIRDNEGNIIEFIERY